MATATITRKTVVTEIRELMDAHQMAGVWLPNVRITRAKTDSHNAGSLYVKTTDGDYLGKIRPDGTTFWVTELAAYVRDEMRHLATEGTKYLNSLGRETGICCYCGRELTDPDSVQRGYGPVCAKVHNLEHPNRHGF